MASVTSWTRLEPRARGNDMRPTLEGRVHDPLWLLGRQWQVGEFQGEDAATPIAARLRGRADLLTAWRAGPDAGDPTAPYDRATPLEVLVEREEPAPDARLAAETGQHLLRLLAAAGLASYTDALTSRWALTGPGADADPAADPDGHRYLSVMAGRVPDGDLVATAIRTSADGLPPDLAVNPLDVTDLRACVGAWLSWRDALVERPTGSRTWQAPRLEYAAAAGVRVDGVDRSLVLAQYPGDGLDWHDFSLGSGPGIAGTGPASEDVVVATLAAPAGYPGMPARRWWQFEDARVDFGGIEAAPEDLARLLLAEFATVYGNDWYLLPVELPIGSLTAVSSLVVLDTFGDRTLVDRVDDPGWSMFELSLDQARPGDERHWDRLFLPPTLGTWLDGEPLEEVLLARDERANLAWAIERVAEGLAGGRVDRFAQWQARVAGEPTPAPAQRPSPDAPPVYRLQTDVPDHWIPLIPHEIAPGRTELRRGAVRRATPAGEVRVEPLGRVLTPGQPLAFPEQEVPREGVTVTRSWQHARRPDGSTALWVGRRVRPGRGESSSGLQFDGLQSPSATE